MKNAVGGREFYRTMLVLAFPVAMQNLMASALNMVDTIMIGQLGKSELAAVGIANQIFFLLMLFLFGICSGASIFTAQYWGQRDVSNIRRVLGIVLLAGVSVAAVFTLVALVAPEQIIRLFMKNDVVVAMGKEYLRPVSLSYIATAVTFAYSFISRSVQQVKVPTIISAVSLLGNTLLNYLLIFGNWGFPAMGVSGAALATVMARLFEMLVLLFVIYRYNYVLAARLRELAALTPEFVQRFFRTAATVILNELSWALGVTMCMAAYARMGEEPYAAVQMAAPVQNISFVMFIGIANACGVMLGNQIGACEEDKAFSCAKLFAVIGPLLAILVGGALILFADRLVSVYNVSEALRDSAAQLLVVYAVFLSAKVFNFINIVGILRSGGDTRYTLMLDSGGIWLLAVPMAFLGGLVWRLPIHLVVALASGEELVKMTLGLRRLYSKKWVRNIVMEPELRL